jgi:epoxide hydrolase-like predicted phosphatase
MVHAVIALRKAGIKTALVSNSWGGYGYPRETFDEMFDAVVISGEVGLRKPQPEIYLMAAGRIGLQPSDCVFVDDFRVNVEGAEAIGMTGILHRDPAKTIEDLERLFEVPLRIEEFLAAKSESPPAAGLQSE